MGARDVAPTVITLVDGDIEVARVAITGDLPGLFVVDVLARLELAGRPHGWAVRVLDPGTPLRLALELAGFAEPPQPAR